MMSRTAPRKAAKGRPGGPRPVPNLTLLEARIRAGLSRDELGRLTGISRKQIAYIERGKARKPHVLTQTLIAQAVKRDILDLFPLR